MQFSSKTIYIWKSYIKGPNFMEHGVHSAINFIEAKLLAVLLSLEFCI